MEASLGGNPLPDRVMERENAAIGQEPGQHLAHGGPPVPTEAPSKPITVTVEEQRSQSVRPGADVTFICTAKSKVGRAGRGPQGGRLCLLASALTSHPFSWPRPQSPAYTLVWTRLHNGKLPARAMDFNGILTIRNVQPSDAGTYVCTGSNMFAMDQGTATLHVQGTRVIAMTGPSPCSLLPCPPGLASVSLFRGQFVNISRVLGPS